MTIPPEAARKLDDSLRRTLEGSAPEDSHRVILTLASPRPGLPPNPQGLDPRTYRQALADRRQKEIMALVEPVRRRLEAHNLTTRGGVISPILVVDGAAADILAALAFPEVLRATADHPISISVA
jgi:hypothetical protein